MHNRKAGRAVHDHGGAGQLAATVEPSEHHQLRTMLVGSPRSGNWASGLRSRRGRRGGDPGLSSGPNVPEATATAGGTTASVVSSDPGRAGGSRRRSQGRPGPSGARDPSTVRWGTTGTVGGHPRAPVRAAMAARLAARWPSTPSPWTWREPVQVQSGPARCPDGSLPDQHWRDLTFLHWRVAPEQVAPLLPRAPAQTCSTGRPGSG